MSICPPSEMPEAAKLQLREWLLGMADSPAKSLALRVAREWDTKGDHAAKEMFRRECESQKFVRWIQSAVADMTVAYRANPDLYGAQP